MNKSEKFYCYQCGKALETVELAVFDQFTGKKQTRLVCMNNNCRDGKENICVYKNGGHKFYFWSSKCKMCGRSKFHEL